MQENKSPLVVSFGLGVDSLAMLVGFAQRGIRPDLIMFADTGNEKEATYEYLPIANAWLRSVGFPEVTVVKYTPEKFKYGFYDTLGSNCMRNATLPSLAFGRKSCSLKWKVAPQDKFVEAWAPARAAWAAGQKVQRCIGYDCSAADSKRYALTVNHHGMEHAKYEYLYPLRDWGWNRDECKRQIAAAGLPVPVKSACWFCPASKPAELHELKEHELKHIVIMETRAKPYLQTIKGLWRKPTKGTLTGRPQPGSMTEYIRSAELLPAADIDHLVATTPTAKDIRPEALDEFLKINLAGHRA
jgi:hypothetical protein